jgi:Xaa-Pro aminopeptidase
MASLRAAMREAGLAALVVNGRDDVRYRGRVFYVTDYWQLLADSHVVITLDDGPIYIGNTVWGLSQARQTDWITEHRISGTPGLEVAAVLSARGLESAPIGLVGLSDASFAYHHVQEIKGALPQAKLVDATDLFEKVRQANSPEELRMLREVSATWNRMFDELEAFIRPGASEVQVAGQAHRIAREHGLRDPMVLVWSTPFIGATSFGSERELSRDSVVTIWIESAAANGYWLEYRRCYTLSPASREYVEYWELLKRALNAGLAVLKPGNMASEFSEEVKRVLAEEGYQLDYVDPSDQHRQYSIHGIGSDAIQGMHVPGRDRVLLKDEVVSLHPMVRHSTPDAVAKFDALGITDNALITPGGGVLLTHDADISRGFIEL